MKRISNFIKAGILVLSGAVVFACNKPFTNPLPPVAGGANNAVAGDVKVLLIVVDGAVGTEVQKANPRVLNSLVDFSIYSWNSLNNYKNTAQTNELGWATLLTGVTSDKHKVTGTNFSNNDFATYPTIFSRLKSVKPGLRSVAYCSTGSLADNLAADATVKGSFSNDAATRDAVVNELATQNSSVVMAEFNSVDLAGAASSYSATSLAYRDAILDVDTKIGDILDAMKRRPTFKNENWMVIITSNKGGNVASTAYPWVPFDDSRHNTFFFCYSPRFSSKSVGNSGTRAFFPYLGTAPVYSGKKADKKQATVADDDRYDLGANKEMTMWCKIKAAAPAVNTDYNYVPFFAKKRDHNSTKGWTFIPGSYSVNNGKTWFATFYDGATKKEAKSGQVCFDNKWHTLVMVVKKIDANTRRVNVYTDGAKALASDAYCDIANTDFGNTDPLNIGVGLFQANDNPKFDNVLITDLRIWNTAVSDSYISSNYCSTTIDPSDPYYGNLIGFWPGFPVVVEGGVKKLKDLSPSGKDMIVDPTNYSEMTFADQATTVCPPPMNEDAWKTVPNSVDIATQIYYWLGVNINGWGLDGKSWIPTYADIN
ncbi:DUF4983 domain-containing protein [Chitinophagaceae bacterium LB-8]|uniref:DUF4983 domain-containing protein n=1 Tax=Paraflavisolibacter caeni TaxID=2982496 RepID=A0A9X3B7L5_9BACT|nr:LamG-like jellyroll fold domain-containing protein [Paraflavisolibacter caeni]MCU7549410.1 DUF4983 domain-containing protein [Paraflavisolibacter caeni]